MKSGVEILSQHGGWQSKGQRRIPSTTRKLVAALRSAASALEHGRHATAKKKIAEILASEPVVQESNAAQLSREDWAEIYYALEYKLSSPAVAGDKKWIAHLRQIMEEIGPDGSFAIAGLENIS